MNSVSERDLLRLEIYDGRSEHRKIHGDRYYAGEHALQTEALTF